MFPVHTYLWLCFIPKLCNFLDKRFLHIVDLSILSTRFFSLYLLSRGLSPFPTMVKLSGFSSAYPNCQCHYSRTSVELWLRKIRVIWTQALWWHERGSDNWDGDWVNTRRWSTSRVGQNGTVPDSARFRHATQDGTRFKTYELFICGIFSVMFPGPSWPWGANRGKRNRGLRSDHCDCLTSQRLLNICFMLLIA